MSEIIRWTGGQPFLTQLLSNLLSNKLKEETDSTLSAKIGELVKSEILPDWRIQIAAPHLQSIENRLLTGTPELSDRKLYAINLYSRVLANSGGCQFNEASTAKRDLLISGLVAKFDKIIDIANPIYKQVFNENWLQETKQLLIQKRSYMPSHKICNRDVFILVDQSGSMTRKDSETGGMVRWDFIKELLEGHIFRILRTKVGEEKICDDIILTFFSPNRPCEVNKYITDPEQIQSVFDENYPDSNTFITPTLEKVINQWFDGRGDKEGFIIIYTDGQFDDRNQFLKLIERTCKRLKNQDELKIVIIGLGSEVDEKFYIQLDNNVSQFTDSLGQNCNIVIFDVVNKMENIIDVLNRQLANPEAGLAPWTKEKYPELFA
ncbi:MAG: VWA domain-containing protein [Coleofasciculaceae cyanobacterium]